MSVYWKETQLFPQEPDKLMKTPRGRHGDLPSLGKGRWRHLFWTMSPMKKEGGRTSQFAVRGCKDREVSGPGLVPGS